MPKSDRLRTADLRAMYQLVSVCRDCGDDPKAWRNQLAEGLCELVDAEFAAVGSGDGLSKGKVEIRGLCDTGLDNGLDRAGWEQSIAVVERDPYDEPVHREYFLRVAKNDGVCLSRTDLTGDRHWYRSWGYERIARAMGTDHCLACYGTLPALPGRHSMMAMARAHGRKDFTAREKAIVQETHALVRPLIGKALARFDEPSPADLPPRVRQVLRCALEGDGDKQIATRLGISPHTVNQYVKTIFNHFGVQSRTELLARWVRQNRSNGFVWATD